MTKKEPVFTKDIPNKQLTVVRDFDAPLHLVWQAWTVSDILDQWWAPKPWKAETKSMDFRAGGQWLYCMVSPDRAERHWCCVDYQAIEPQVSVRSTAVFCDEEGNPNSNMPKMYWHQQFRAAAHGTPAATPAPHRTTVTVVLTFPSDAEFETILKMGFQQGFTMGLANLDEFLIKHHETIARESTGTDLTQTANSRLGLPSLP
jgi:uncharacterized protein YndB with AHSA1/START domain